MSRDTKPFCHCTERLAMAGEQFRGMGNSIHALSWRCKMDNSKRT
ncbi:hypothetical protein [Salmonella enterica]